MIENFRELAEGASDVHVELRRGDLVVRVAEGAAPALSWSSDADEAPEVSRGGPLLRIRQREEFLGPRRMDLQLTLPPGAERYELRTGLGEIETHGLAGDARVESGSGEVRVEQFGGRLQLKSGNGEVHVERARGELRVHSGNGEVELRQVEGTIDVNTGRGEIEIELAGPSEVRATSGLGEVELKGATAREVRLTSGKGDLECETTLMAGKHQFSTGFGDVAVLLPPDAQARVDLQTGFGDVDSDFPLVRVGRSGPMGFGGIRMVGSIGEGEAEIEVQVRTGKGDLELRRAGGPVPGARREHFSVGVKGFWEDQKHLWKGMGAELATAISAEVATAIASSFGGQPSAPPRPPHPGAPPHPDAPPRPGAPPAPPPPVDLGGGPVRSSQTPFVGEPPTPAAERPDGDVSVEVDVDVPVDRDASEPAADPLLEVLRAVARGEVTPEEAEQLLARSGRADPI